MVRGSLTSESWIRQDTSTATTRISEEKYKQLCYEHEMDGYTGLCTLCGGGMGDRVMRQSGVR